MSDIIRDIQNAVDRANSMGLSDFMFNDPHPIGRHSRTSNNKGCSSCSTKRCMGRNRSTRGTQRRTSSSTCRTQRRTSRNTHRGSCWKRSTSGTQRGSCWKRRSTCSRQRCTSRKRCSSNNCRWLCCNNFRNKRKWCF